MAAMSSGKKARPRKLVKGGTTSTRKHRFESFNQRVTKLNIDPIRRRRRNEVEEEDLQASSSYFRVSLDRWKDLNLSENFTNFVRDVEPLCSSLPQLLHYNQRVFNTLANYIDKRDALSLEPLLDLLSKFAHDLGVRFEEHFSRAVTLVASVAAKHTDVEVIEWSFTCLAWLFKYLSRLLVPNLRPVFDIMASLLGREPQKLHTTRFAAEAMSFLVRKAAAVYPKDAQPLNIIMCAIRDDILGLCKQEVKRGQIELYQHGLMTLLLNAIKGIDRKLYSGGPSIYRCMVDHLFASDQDQRRVFADIVYGVTAALVHHSDAKNFQPLQDIILEQIHGLDSDSNASTVTHCGNLLFIISTVRKGSRIQAWTPILDSLIELLEFCKTSNNETIAEIYKSAAVVLQSSPLDLVLPKFRMVMNTIASESLAPQFLPFCNYFCDLGRERFQDLLLPYFSKFIVAKWEESETELCMSVPKIIGANTRKKPMCPAPWQEKMVKTFEEAIDHEERTVQCNSYLELMDCVSLAPETADRIMDILEEMVHRDLQTSSYPASTGSFTLGTGLKTIIQHSPDSKTRLLASWLLICKQAPYYATLPRFLQAVLLLINARESPLENADSMIHALVDNLHSNSHSLRELSLLIMDALYTNQYGKSADVINTALAIESSPLDLQSARTISMHARKLGSQYEQASSNQWLQKAIPHFCFGMLTFKLSQACDDAVAALKQICETKVGEEIVSALAFRWLEEPEPNLEDGNSSNSRQIQNGPLTDFQCSNFIQVETLMNHDVAEIAAAAEHLQAKFDATHSGLQQRTANAPALALRVLSVIPQVAEKRSRYLVPMFLSWAADSEESVETPTEDVEASLLLKESEARQKLRRRDQKTMLDLFGSFQNPKVLYRSSDVFEALQRLLTNGNVEIQRSALKALSTWKIEGLQPYQDNLMNLLDDARFRDEISTFLHVDIQSSVVQEDHRPELMPVMLRLLYGRMIAGTGGSKSQTVIRKAVLQALSRLDEAYLQVFVHIALGSLSDVRPIEDTRLNEKVVAREYVSVRKQVGLINMTKDLLEVLGSRLVPFAQNLANAVLYCMIRAARSLHSQRDGAELAPEKGAQVSLLKVVRQTGLQCLNLLFRSCHAESLQFYVPAIFAELLTPRLGKLPIETAQSVSGILQLFSTWTSSEDTVVFLADYDTRALKSVIDCLEVPSAKEEVKLFVIDDILKKIVQLSKPADKEDLAMNSSSQHEKVAQRVLQPNVDSILTGAGSLLRKSPSKELLGSAIELVSMLAPLVEGSTEVMNLLEICAFLLDQPSQRVNPKSKGELLQIIQHFIPLIKTPLPADLQDHIFNTVSSLFGYFKDRANRLVLSQVMHVLAQKDPELEDVAWLCTRLNAFSLRKIDEPDFDERLKAFNIINEMKFRMLNVKQWRPLLYNMLHYVKDTEELAIRSNASFALRRFVETNVLNADNSERESRDLVKLVLLPALRSGASESSELVRAEYLSIMAHLVRHNPQWQEVNDMSVLLVSDDEEASFFGNILHIQQHRRLRALRRLAAEAEKGGLRSSNVAHFFIPLIEHFIFDKADAESAHNLSAETVVAIGVLASSLGWPQFRAMFRRFTSYIHSKPEVEKTVIKLLGVIIDALAKAADEKENATDINPGIMMQESDTAHVTSTLAMTMPRQEKLAGDLTENLLPLLVKYLHDKDEATVSLRVPVSVSVVKLLKLLPPDRFKDRLPPVLTDVCHILRSRAQESRDLTRKTLVDVSTLIGPAYFGFVLKELRSSLARGYQLHVLSFTVHSMLVATSSIFTPGDLDYCLPQIVAIIMDDIFGATGQEKDAEEYISKMKEVKSSKSYDSMELIAKTATVEHFVQLIRPLQALLEEKLDLRRVKKIDELLRRIGVGLLRNEAVQDHRVLVFCYEIIQEVYKTPGPSQNDRPAKEGSYSTKRLLIDYKGANRTGSRGSTSSYNYKLLRFALDILRSVLHKHDALQTPANLTGFIPVIGDAIVGSNEEIQTSALRLLTAIIKVPLKELDENAAIYVAECVKIVKNQTSTNVELAQAALKLVSAILRERRTVEIREKDLAYLLKRLIPDLDEPDKQGVAFNFLKAIMMRKIVITEVYEVLDTVATIMVTNQTRSARDMARGAYFQSIMDYPQSKGRFSKQLDFLVKNLEYKHQEGRQSVMEAIHLLFNKVGEGLIQDIVETFFVPLVLQIVNDESQECREMAGALLKKAFERADTDRIQSFLARLRGWLSSTTKPVINRVALQGYGIYLDTNGVKAEKELLPLQFKLDQILKSNLKNPAEAEWELLYFSLQTFSRICQIFPGPAFAPSTAPLWSSVRQCLSFPHAWVKLSAAKLLGTFFADFARKNASGNEEKIELPLKGSNGLYLNEQEITELTRASLNLLRVKGISEDLATQSVRNLVFLAKIMAQTSMNWPQKGQEPGSDAIEDGESQDEDEVEGVIPVTTKPALGHIVYQASRILRRGPLTTRAAGLVPLHAALSLLGALANMLQIGVLTPHLHVLMVPVHNLTDTSIPAPFSTDNSFTEGHKTLVSNAQELMSVLQKKLGTTEYINILSQVRERVKARREGRRVKRRIEAVAEPERAHKVKKRKGEKKKEKRKERGADQRSQRRGW
ncbi:hypothetical protein OEA41_002310 [Lepraria neglecta]|uniref:HEAT repeat protein n=1 Tax=Lepraria neglecta TaxID=209136 RepID=A0AAE0DM56_9LECA|nr:hypothetical protein OEA41_002310 [Lepraria neglecta]